MNIVIPMAGLGNRFKDSGFKLPKPLIDVNGVSMIEKSIRSLGITGQYIFIIRETNYSHDLCKVLKNISPDCIIKKIDYVTDGPACTVDIVREHINNSSELIVANCDQIMWWDGGSFLNYCRYDSFDGVLVTYNNNTSKNSYARIDRKGNVLCVKEKEVISNISLNGIHYWKRGEYFIDSYNDMVNAKDVAENGEYYVGPTYNYMIAAGKPVGIYHIPEFQHHAVGTPEDLREYIRNENSQT
jgi:dTDP-glucose pyrophosphorylase